MHDERFAAVAGLQTIDYDEETVVFNGATWETHVLNAAAAEILAMATAAPRSVDEIARALAHWLEPGDTDDAHAHAARVVDELHALRLIVRASAPRSDSEKQP